MIRNLAVFLRTTGRLALAGTVAALALASTGCPKTTNEFVAAPIVPQATVNIDADAASLLPFGALAIANLDAKQLTNSTVGGDLAALGERMIPFAGQIDFQIKRDLDHAYLGMYSFSGADVLAVLTGTFHPDKLEAAAGKGLNTPYGVVVVSTYAGRKFYTVANYGFTMLTEHTALAGTEAAMRRALDRIAAGTVKREMATWMGDWVTQPGYPVLVASDVTKQSFGKTVTGYIPWIQGVQYVRIRGRFNPDQSFGMSGALTYPDSAKAANAAQGLGGISQSFTMMAVLKIIGIAPLVRNMKVNPAGNDVQFQTVIDEKQTRDLIRLITGRVGSGTPPSIPPPGTATPPAGGGGSTI